MWLGMCSTARKAGDFRVLFSPGATTFHDIPWFLHEAIMQGMTILSWYENYTDTEVPPESIWEDPEALEMWWKRVRQDRGDTGSGLEVPDAQDMASNDFARTFADLRGDD